MYPATSAADDLIFGLARRSSGYSRAELTVIIVIIVICATIVRPRMLASRPAADDRASNDIAARVPRGAPSSLGAPIRVRHEGRDVSLEWRIFAGLEDSERKWPAIEDIAARVRWDLIPLLPEEVADDGKLGWTVFQTVSGAAPPR